MELFEFLKILNLLEYQQVLLDNGVDEVEILMELTENHFERLGFKIGHIIKVRKAVERFKISGVPSCENYKLTTTNSLWDTEKVLKTASLKITRPDATGHIN
jgi:hypothetical protein